MRFAVFSVCVGSFAFAFLAKFGSAVVLCSVLLRAPPARAMGRKLRAVTKKDVYDLAAAATDGAEAYLRAKVRTACIVGSLSCTFPGVGRATSEALPGVVCASSVIGFEWSFKHKGTPWQPINVKAAHEKRARRFVYNKDRNTIKIPRQILDAHLVSYTLSHLDQDKLDGFQWALGIASPT